MFVKYLLWSRKSCLIIFVIVGFLVMNCETWKKLLKFDEKIS